MNIILHNYNFSPIVVWEDKSVWSQSFLWWTSINFIRGKNLKRVVKFRFAGLNGYRRRGCRVRQCLRMATGNNCMPGTFLMTLLDLRQNWSSVVIGMKRNVSTRCDQWVDDGHWRGIETAGCFQNPWLSSNSSSMNIVFKWRHFSLLFFFCRSRATIFTWNGGQRILQRWNLFWHQLL